MQEALATYKSTAFGGYEDLIDIRGVKLRDGVSRLENALYFLEQITDFPERV